MAAFAAALLAALAATPLARKVALHFGVLDAPSEKKFHTDPVPYLGGVAIILAFTSAVAAGGVIGAPGGAAKEIWVILGGGLSLAAVGLWDDLKLAPPWSKLLLEVALSVALYLIDVRVQLFHVAQLDLLLTVIWIVGITNSVNLLDNMDGLGAGVCAIAAAYFLLLAAVSGQFLVASLAAALLGCALGFLWYNRPPARIFMGDAGSLFLGFMLAVLGVKLRFENIEDVTFFVPVAVMGLAIMDTVLVCISRIRRGRSPFQGGRDHMSHRLVKIGLPSKAAVGLLLFAAAGFGWIGLVIAFAQTLTAFMLIGALIILGVFTGWLLMKVPV